MGKALSMDLRQRAVDAYARGEGTQLQIARRFGIGTATLGRWLSRVRATGRPSAITDYKHGPMPRIDVVSLANCRKSSRTTATQRTLSSRSYWKRKPDFP